MTNDPPASGRWLTPGVAGIGAASFFSDFGHEIATAVLPSFLTSVLHASAGALGLIEGISDAMVGLSKLFGGSLANNPESRARIASGGYLGTAVATAAIGLAAAPWQAGVFRAIAWVSRGLRSPARDSLLASLAPKTAYGRAFGLERAGDNLGAVAGPLLAAVLIAQLGIRPTIYFALVPGVFAAIAITIAAREAPKLVRGGTAQFSLRLGALKKAGIVRPLLPVGAFELGNIAATLLILRSTQLLATGHRSYASAASIAILIYAAHNAFASVVALLGGRWIDHAGPAVVFASGALLYFLAYCMFALTWTDWPPLLLAFVLAGSGIGLAETAESALVARSLPDELRGSGFGLLGGVQSFGDFLSSAVVGLLYTVVSPLVGFAYAAAWMLVALGGSGLVALQARSQGPSAGGAASP